MVTCALEKSKDTIEKVTSEQGSEADRAQGSACASPHAEAAGGGRTQPGGGAGLGEGGALGFSALAEWRLLPGRCPVGQRPGHRRDLPTHPPGLAYICEGLKEQRKGLATLVLWNNQLTHTGMAFLGMTLVSGPARGRGGAPQSPPPTTTTSPSASTQHRHLPPVTCLSLAHPQV